MKCAAPDDVALMEVTHQGGPGALASAFYVEALIQLSRSTIPFLVGGTFAFERYVHFERETKDLDVFVRPDDVPRAMNFFRERGYVVELPFPHWLGKVRRGDYVMDLIFSSGNGVARVDDRWFEHAVAHEVLGLSLRLSPPEEMIWSKAFVQERERFDGADIMHLFRQLGPSIDWRRLLERFGPHWRVLLSHVVLFGFVYPNQRHRIPTWVLGELTRRLASERSDPANLLCNGTLLSRQQYLHDITSLGYHDARIAPAGLMKRKDAENWTAAIDEEK